MLVVTVHNIGGSASPPGTIEVRTDATEVLAAVQTSPLEPPHDLQPKTATVRIPIDSDAKPTWVVLDPNNEIAEITEANNTVRVQTP